MQILELLDRLHDGFEASSYHAECSFSSLYLFIYLQLIHIGDEKFRRTDHRKQLNSNTLSFPPLEDYISSCDLTRYAFGILESRWGCL